MHESTRRSVERFCFPDDDDGETCDESKDMIQIIVPKPSHLPSSSFLPAPRPDNIKMIAGVGDAVSEVDESFFTAPLCGDDPGEYVGVIVDDLCVSFFLDFFMTHLSIVSSQQVEHKCIGDVAVCLHEEVREQDASDDECLFDDFECLASHLPADSGLQLLSPPPEVVH